MRSIAALAFLGTSLCLTAIAADARLAISGNDGKQLQKGEEAGVTPDSISVIDLGSYPPKIVGQLDVPAAMIGPPEAVVVSRDESFAIVTAAQKVNPADPMHPLDNDQVSVIDLSMPAKPRLVETVSSGAGASGITMNRAQTLVLVAAKMDDAVIVLSLKGRKLARVGRVELGKGSAPTDVVFARDGRHAYAVGWGVNKIIELAIDGTKVTATGQDVATGKVPYGASVTPDGNWLVNTNLGGALEGEDHTGTLTMMDLKTHRVVASVPVGKTPEHVTLSPDGKYAAVVLANGAANVKSDPKYDQVTGILKVYAVAPGKLTEVAHADSCHWAQGATFSQDGKLVLQQCAAEHQILVYRFDGKSLVEDKGAALKFQSRPGAIATGVSR
jgi:6-phosphogluconolactonase (cycloisomerase 2 family)